jgi:hypothetical protein
MVSLLVAQVDLFFQVTIFLLLTLGMLFERKHLAKIHGQLMLTAVLLNVVSFLAVMAPAMDKIGGITSDTLRVVAMGHASLGGLALFLSFWIVGSWLLQPFLTQHLKMRCYSALNKKIMWAILFLWLGSLILGFFLYMMVNTHLLGSFQLTMFGS